MTTKERTQEMHDEAINIITTYSDENLIEEIVKLLRNSKYSIVRRDMFNKIFIKLHAYKASVILKDILTQEELETIRDELK